MPPSTTNPTHRLPVVLTNPTIPPGSLILVTGANGLNASNTISFLLQAGYLVRGTVRSATKASYLTDLFPFMSSQFSLFEIPSVTTPVCWTPSLKKNVSGLIHCIGATTTENFPSESDVDTTAKKELKWQINLLSLGSLDPDPAKQVTLTQCSWNEEAVVLAPDKSIDPKEKGLACYMALKTLVEQGIWAWVNQKNPPYAFNSLLLDTVIRGVLCLQHQGVPPSGGMVHWIWQGKNADELEGILPQWHINAGDAAKLYVVILASSPQVDRERVFGFGDRFSFYRVKEILQREFPEHKVWAEVKDNGWDKTTVPNERGAELLSRVAQTDGWTGLEESVLENAKAWEELEGTGVTDDRYSRLN